MTELRGTLDGVGLPAIVRFLATLKKTGCLRVVRDDWRGEIAFQAGALTDASFASRSGLSALDALVQVLAGGTFSFDTSSCAGGARTIELTPDALQTHLDELMACIANGKPTLPAMGAVPKMVVRAESSAGEDPLPLDRGSLQTLLAVDGRRTVREIVAQRGSFDALWQLGRLAEVGVVGLGAASSFPRARDESPPGDPGPPNSANARSDVGILPPSPREERGASGVRCDLPVETLVGHQYGPEVGHDQAPGHCPELGFEHDPDHSFTRPTRLHRCFAAGTPLPVSLDEQRELCLTDRFGTCPRLTAPGLGLARASVREVAEVPEPESDDSRSVRLPIRFRDTVSPSDLAIDPQADTSSEPSPLVSAGAIPRSGAASRPTPLRARMDRARGAAVTSTATPPDSKPPEPADAAGPHAPGPGRLVVRPLASPGPSEVPHAPIRLLAGAAFVVIVIGVIAYLFMPQISSLFVNDSADLAGLPNASAVAAGTPVAQVSARRESVEIAPAAVAAPTLQPEAAPAPVLVSQAPRTAPTSALPAAVVSQAPATPRAVVSVQPTPAQPGATVSSSAPPGASAPSARLFDESFADNAHHWPSNPQGTAWLTNGSYRLMTRQAGQFVAVGAPIPAVSQDVSVSARFRKLDGTPPGGGFGVILRDQGASSRDGTNQSGQYYVLEVGDNGEVGIWRRDADHWVDLLAWQRSEAVHPGTATNELTATAIGSRLSLSVNGTPVATRTDATLPTGGVGLLVGGDGNQVAVERFSVQTP